MRSLFGRTPKPDALTIFFATDIHGSDRCFRKFLNAARFYGAQHLIMGGDITGKTLVTIERTSRGWNADYNDHSYVEIDEKERAALEQRIRDGGQYPVVGERDELLALADETTRERRFVDAAVDGVRRWVELAEERLASTGVRCYVTPGNDDFWEIDDALRGSSAVEFVEGRCVALDDDHEMITTGYSNPTPWKTPRELPEDQYAERLAGMQAEVENPSRCIAVLHPPPYGTRLDQAPAIDAELKVQSDSGQARMVPVGSTAVREHIERCQPLLSLHGHVHDSRAEELLGRTLCVNPGSEYTEGVLRGALIRIAPDHVVSHQLVAG